MRASCAALRACPRRRYSAAAAPFHPATIRAEFPVLAAIDADASDPRIFLDGPGGTQVHGSVVDAMAEALVHKMSNIGYDYTSSLGCLDLVHSARTAGAAFLNCEGCEVVYGPSMTALAFQLSASLLQTLRPGDEVFLSRSEHEGNVSPWLHMAERAGCTVRWVPLDPHTYTLDLAAFEEMLAAAEGPPRFFAVGAASNATGTIHDVKRAVGLAKAAGVDYTLVDAVHYAPHQLIDVREWGCDFALTSAYKWFGPHQSMLFGREALLRSLPTTKVRPAPDELPTLESYELSRWEMGTLPFETIAGQVGPAALFASFILVHPQRIQTSKQSQNLKNNPLKKLPRHSWLRWSTWPGWGCGSEGRSRGLGGGRRSSAGSA